MTTSAVTHDTPSPYTSNVLLRVLAAASNYSFALPALIVVGAINVYGIIANFVYATWDWNGISPTHENIGVGNFQQMLADPQFWQALLHTAEFGVVVVFVQLVLGFLLAVLVRTRTFGTGVLRSLLFVPVVLSGAVVGTSFRELLMPDGAFNQMLQALGLRQIAEPWLGDPALALWTIAAINIWQFTGYSFIVYDANFGQIDDSVLEAARVDGASTSRLIRDVVFPMMRGAHIILIVLGFIGALKTFELVYLTTGGGPGTSTQVLSTYIYQLAIPQFQAGYAAALSSALTVIALVLAVLQIRSARRVG